MRAFVQVLRGVRGAGREAGLSVVGLGGPVDAAADPRRGRLRRVPVDGDAAPARAALPRSRRPRPPDPLERRDGARLQRPLDADVRPSPVPLRPAQPAQLYLHLSGEERSSVCRPTDDDARIKVRLHQSQLTLTISELSILVMTTATHVPHQPTAVA